MEITTPKEFVRMYYYILQAHTTLRPGPHFRKILKRAGIQEVEPPSKAVLAKRLQNVQQSNSHIFTAPNTKMPPLISVQAGGAWYDSIYDKIDNFSREYQNTLTMAFLGLTAVYITRIEDLRIGDVTFFDDGTNNFLNFLSNAAGAFVPLLAVLATATGYDMNREERYLRGTREAEEIREREIERWLRQRRIEENEIIRQLAEELARDDINRFNILDIPSSGQLTVKGKNNAGNSIVDPISFEDFKTGDKVAVIKENKKTFMLQDSLEAWIANPTRNGPPKHPITNETFTKEDVKIYTLELTDTNLSVGGKRKSRKAKKTRKASRKH